jgi:hypothetical protein
MDNLTLLDHLAQVERHVSIGLKILERRRGRICNLEQKALIRGRLAVFSCNSKACKFCTS